MMGRLLMATAVAVGVTVSAAPVSADDSRVVPLGRYQPTESGFAAGTTTPDPISEYGEGDLADTERVTWGRRYYRPYYGGFSYYRAPSYYNFYRPGFSYSYYSYSYPRFYAPRSYYYSSFYPRYNYGYSNFGYSSFGYSNYGYGGFCPIGLQEKIGMAASVVDLALRAKALTAHAPEPYPDYDYTQPVPSQPLPQPQPANPNGSFRYDGGPSNPVPMPGPDATAPKAQPVQPTADDGTLQISLPIGQANKYRYRAYGEK